MIWLAVALAAPDPRVAAAALEFHSDGVVRDEAAVAAAYAAACSGEDSVCSRSWEPGDLHGAATVLEPVCEAGDPVACLVVGWSCAQITPGIYHQEAPRAGEAAGFFEKACDAGVERGCVGLGALKQLGVGVKQDPDAAFAIHQTACQQGELAGCRRLGAMLHGGLGVKRDIDKAETYYKKACDGGFLGGCNSLGLLNHLAVGGRVPDPPTAIGFYIPACDAGHRSACNNLEKLYALGMRPEQDPPGRLALWQQGCERDVAAACANGADLAADADMMGSADLALAKSLREKGCALDDPYSCGMLGKSLLTEDFERGQKLLDDACFAGIGEACHELGVLYGTKGERFDVVRSATYQSRGCEARVPRACAALADAHWRGKGVDKDRERAVELYAMACTRGVESACKRAAR